MWGGSSHTGLTNSLVVILTFGFLMIGLFCCVSNDVKAVPSGWNEGAISDQLLFFGSCDGAVDSEGRRHVVFWDGYSPYIQYGVSEGGGFTLSRINLTSQWGYPEPRLALDKDDEPHIIYSDDDRLMYVTRSGDVWRNESIATVARDYFGDVYMYFDLAIDDAGNPCVAYFSASVIYLVRTDGHWEEKGNWSVGYGGWSFIGQEFSMVFDPGEGPVICYQNHSDGNHITCQRWNGSTWEQSDVMGRYDLIYDSALAVDKDGRAHLVFYTYNETVGSSTLQYALFSNGTWTDMKLADTASYNNANPVRSEIAIDSVGVPHVCYVVNEYDIKYEYLEARLYYTYLDHGQWVTVQLEEGCSSLSMTIDLEDKPLLFYTKFMTGVYYMTIGDVPEPSPPNMPCCFQASGCDGSVALSWEPPNNDGASNISGYRIYRSNTSGGEGEMIASLSSTRLSYIDDDLDDGQVLYYRITALNAVGEGVGSSEQMVTTSSVTGSPPHPVKASISVDGSAYRIVWTMPDDGGSPVRGFRIFWSFSDSEPRLLTTLGPSDTDYLVFDMEGILIDEWKWPIYYWVVAFNDIGQSPMQSTPLVILHDQGSSDYMVIGLMVAAVAAVTIMATFLIVRRMGRRAS